KKTTKPEKHKKEKKKKEKPLNVKKEKIKKEKPVKVKKEKIKKEKPVKVKKEKQKPAKIKKEKTPKIRTKAAKNTGKVRPAKPKNPKKQKKNSNKAAFTRKMGAKMMVVILPVIMISMTVLTVISVQSGSKSINSEISSRMEAELQVQDDQVTSYFRQITDIADMLSNAVLTSFDRVDIVAYENLLTKVVEENDFVVSSGIWFEPYVFNLEQKYTGPLARKDNNVTYISTPYSEEDTNYTKQQFYSIAQAATQTVLTEAIYDITQNTFKITAVVPLICDGTTLLETTEPEVTIQVIPQTTNTNASSSLGTETPQPEDYVVKRTGFIGCVTIDVKLDDIKEFIEATTVGDKGKATLLSAEGTYMAGSSQKNISKRLKITKEENESLAKAGEEIVANKNGRVSYTEDGEKYNIYYSTLGTNGWKVMITIPQSELTESVEKMTILMILVCVAAACVTAVVVALEVSSIIKRINRVKKFAGILADGDFTTEPIRVKTKDELGMMSESLNIMYANNKEVIENIAEHSEQIDDSSKRLNEAAQRLTEQFKSIQSHMNEVNESMLTASAATEQVNASTEEVLSNVNMLAGETKNSMHQVSEIKQRAAQVGDNSRQAYNSATELSVQFEEKMQVTIANAKVVENIGELASVISEIADQIDLLSLNASIEAARAGEQGKGFAVVATEIGKLAKETTEAVDRIQNTIVDVQSAFDDLINASDGILDFVKNTVTPDYDKFVGVAEQYGEDAENIVKLSKNISDMSGNIKMIMTEVSAAIQSIAEASQTTADISSGIMLAVDEVTEDVNDISGMSEETSSIAVNLNSVVGKFKL
ncbi:MAG: methyl-accepting chemotaxis protein, partial [Lachnospiraceae bacterium]|nr:methyl-accepting chemotaxis protein [Lachnospiraceae bacterium]